MSKEKVFFRIKVAFESLDEVADSVLRRNLIFFLIVIQTQPFRLNTYTLQNKLEKVRE